jgi:hypothetical protein
MTFSTPFDLPEDALEPADVRFLDVRVEPWPDNRRVRAMITLTPFTQRPNLYAEVRNPQGEAICSAHVIETMDARMVFTLHLRGEPVDGAYSLDVRLSYEDTGEIDQRTVEFDIHAAAE